ncbi:hypothetical protein ACFQFG_20710 [Methylobacterium persicinum]
MLRRGRHPRLARADEAGAGQAPGRVQGAQGAGIVAEAAGEVVGHVPAVAEAQGHGGLGLARHYPGRAGDAAPARLDPHEVAVGDSLPGRERRAQGDHVLPHHLGQGLGQFLKPREVGMGAVVEGAVRAEHHLDARSRRGGLGLGRRPRHAHILRRWRAVGEEPQPQGLREPCLESRVVLAVAAPLRLEQAEGIGALVRPGEKGEHLLRRAAVVERRYRRLDQPHRPVRGAHVAPGFEGVGQGQVPVGVGAGLVVVEPRMDLERHALHPLGEVEGAGRLVDRVGPQHDQRLHLAPVHRPGEVGEDPAPPPRRAPDGAGWSPYCPARR